MRALWSSTLLPLISLMLVSGCSSGVDASVESSTDALTSPRDARSSQYEPSAISGADRLVAVRIDTRRCAAPRCGGYFVRELNRDADERYASSLDLSSAGLDDASIESALAAPDALVLRGRFGTVERVSGTGSFVASEVWRGMPGIDSSSDDGFFTIAPRDPPIECIVAPCPEEIATLVNSRWRLAFDGVDVAPAAAARVDANWLAARVLDHGAVVAASWERGPHDAGGYEWLLRTSQVYVRLPDRVGPCPAAPVTKCDAGTIPTFERNADRCLIQVACVVPTVCPMFMPVCAAGYSLAAWAGTNGCNQFACDPTFLTD